MKTLFYDIIECSDKRLVDRTVKNHSNCTILTYKRLDESGNKEYLKNCEDYFDLSEVEVRSVVSRAKQDKTSFLSKKDKTKEEIKEIEAELVKIETEIKTISDKKSTNKRNKKLKKLKKTSFKLNKKLHQKHRFMSSEIVFGGRHLLRQISYLSNHLDVKGNKEKRTEIKKEYRKKRRGSAYFLGEANQKGNRFFEFDLPNKLIIFKPRRGVKVTFKLCDRNDEFDSLLQEKINNKEIAITVTMTSDRICLSYDPAVLCGYSINKKERNEEIKKRQKQCLTKEEHDAVAKAVCKEYYESLDKRKLANKLAYRFMGIDTNPEHIGYSVIDLLPDNSIKVIEAGSFSLKTLCKKTKKSSDHPDTVHRNNKRKHERKEVVCEIFKLMKHYKVGTLVMEDLNFKDDVNNEKAKEFNRKVKNIWDREQFLSQIEIKCTEVGIILEPINPLYTSLIGNLSYQVFDPVAASIEIARRGATKYVKDCFFPVEGASTIRTMEVVAKRNHIDVGLIRDASWRERYTILASKKGAKLRYRWGESEGRSVSFSLGSYKSRVVHSLYCL